MHSDVRRRSTLHAQGAEREPAPQAAGRDALSSRPWDTEVLEEAFLAWVHGADKPQQLYLDGPDASPTQLTWALGLLCTAKRRLLDDVAGALGLQLGSTVGTAATELLLAVNDPGGPRCRSYRAAAHYLHDHRGLLDALAAE